VPTFVAFFCVSCKNEGITKVFHVFRQISLKGVASSCWARKESGSRVGVHVQVHPEIVAQSSADLWLWPFSLFFPARGVAFKMSLIICCSLQTQTKTKNQNRGPNQSGTLKPWTSEALKPFSGRAVFQLFRACRKKVLLFLFHFHCLQNRISLLRLGLFLRHVFVEFCWDLFAARVWDVATPKIA